MALTPYPSLATLPEVIANGGKIPASSIDVFAARTVYASSIPGVVLDCNIATGAKNGGGTATDNAAKINAVLATATAANPVHLVMDGGSLMGVCPIMPATGHVTISGNGWDTGFFIKSGTAQNGLQNFANTDLARFNAAHPSGSQAGVGANVTLRDFRLNCNRGTFPNGNVSSSGPKDGTLTGGGQIADTPDARSPYPTTGYFLTGISLVGIDHLHIDHVWCYDSPAYSLALYHCTDITIDASRFECVDSQTDNNTDGIHINGGCTNVRINGCYVKSGDDAFAINIHEGDGASASDIIITDCVVDCLTLGRFYGISTTGLNKVQLRGITGIARWWGMLVGEGNTLVDNVVNSNRSIMMKDIDVQITHGDGPLPPAMLIVAANVGLLDMDGISIVDPVVAHSLIYMSSLTGVITLAAINDVNVCRSALGNSVVNFLTGVKGSITTLEIDGFRIADIAGSSYSAAPNFLDLTSPCTIGRLWIGDVDPTHITALTNAAGQITTKAGPGLAASGF